MYMYIHTLRLIEQYDAQILPKLAKTVLLAQDIREQSWNEVTKQCSVTHFGAAIQAVEQTGIPQHFEDLIGGWNQYYWNDIQSWADTVQWQEAVKQMPDC